MGYIDVHSHILPHMDDGARDMNETMKMLQIACEEGITHIIATPHYKSGRFPADSGRLWDTLLQVQKVAEEQNIPIRLYGGNEIYYHSELEEKLDTGALTTLNDTQYVLIEFSPLENYLYIRNAVEDILGMGYTPIVAHVERYQCMCKDTSCVAELKNMGCEMQVNAESVTGDAGWRIKSFVHKLLAKHLIDYIGTDAHNTSGRKPAMEKCAAILCRKYGKDLADALLFDNAAERLLNL